MKTDSETAGQQLAELVKRYKADYIEARLEESQTRIQSMSLVHEQLYRTDDLTHVPANEFIEGVAHNLHRLYASADARVSIDLQIERELMLDIDTAIPCGLIINELISNALKYAFKGKEKGKLVVSVKAINDSLTIVISDNGKGLPENIDFRNTESLGLQLVVTLVEQINGKISLETKKGTKFTIEFVPPRTNQ